MDTRSTGITAVTVPEGSAAEVVSGAGVAATAAGLGVCIGVSLDTLLTGSDVALACRKDFGSAAGCGCNRLGASLPERRHRLGASPIPL